MKLMWQKTTLGGLALVLAIHVQGQMPADAGSVRAGVFRVLVESDNLNKEGDHDSALALLEELDLSGSSPAELAFVRKNLANTYQMAGDHERARAHYQLVLDEPANFTVEQLNQVWYRLATASYQLGDYEDVLRVVQAWRDRVDQPTPDAHKILAFAHLKLGNQSAVLTEGQRYIDALREAGEAIPSSFRRFLEQARRPPGETSDLHTTDLEELASRKVLEVLIRANEMIDLRRFAKTAALLTETIETHKYTVTEVALLREKLAWALAHQGDMEGAREQFREITVSPGELPSHMLDKIWMRLASASYKAEAYEDALESAEVWKTRIGEPPALYFRIVAMAHWQLDNRESAVSFGKRYVDEARRTGEEIATSFRDLFDDALGDELARGN